MGVMRGGQRRSLPTQKDKSAGSFWGLSGGPLRGDGLEGALEAWGGGEI